jgi:hypothetical protein
LSRALCYTCIYSSLYFIDFVVQGEGTVMCPSTDGSGSIDLMELMRMTIQYMKDEFFKEYKKRHSV